MKVNTNLNDYKVGKRITSPKEKNSCSEFGGTDIKDIKDR